MAIKYLDTTGLTTYSKLVKSAISNVQTSADAALAEAQKKEVLPFAGIVSGVDVLTVSTTVTDVVYDETKKTFLGRLVKTSPALSYTYYNNWQTREQYEAELLGTPFTNKIYVNTGTKESYYFDGSSLSCLGIQKGSLATINGQSLEDGGDIELDFTVAEFVSELPDVSKASKSKIYLVPSTESGTNNSYKEYIKVTVSGTDKWEQIGEYKAEVDLTPYLKKTDAASTYVAQVSGKGLSTNDYTTAEKSKLAGIAANANNYSLPAASASALGGIKTGYTQSGKTYPVVLNSSNQAYVSVPWTDTSYTLPLAASGTRGGIQLGFTNDTTNKKYAVQVDSEKAYVQVPWVNTTYSAATQSASGLMSAADKKIVDGISTTYVPNSSVSTISETEITTLWNNA